MFKQLGNNIYICKAWNDENQWNEDVNLDYTVRHNMSNKKSLLQCM